ncbi:MAG: hypothetical protein NC080_08795 [Paraprevotella sp.]|nr:hypothetical protein [Paraprevotella sp.]
MRNRLSNGSKHVALAACMLALGANFSACTDDYVLDEQKPTWLNSSIYETLESNGGYTKYLTLIADPDVNSGDSSEGSLVEILSRTGSKTIFAATDKAWDNFFANNAKLPKTNPWHYAQSYEQLSPSQKKLLLHTSMLNNAITMENLASSSGSSPLRGQYLRRYTDVETVDTVAHVAVTDLPKSYWSTDRQTSFDPTKDTPEVDQWSRIRDGGLLGYDSIYMVLDSSLSMMVHFTNEYMAMNKITDADFRVFMGRERITSDVHIYDALLDSADITCENGYINMTEKPLAPLGNMAEVIRTNGKTNIFSHILDRFSVPFQNKTVGRLFARLHPDKFQETDTLYTKRYYSKRSFGSSSNGNVELRYDERGNLFANGEPSLKFDPGWNTYHPAGSTPQEDMGAMFVPNDEQLLYYFNEGGGRNLIKEYTLNPLGSYNINNLEALYQDIDQIPLNIVYKIVNQSMFDSFVESVPSKMEAIREEVTLEPIFTGQDTKLKADGGNIDTVMMACNGAVYIMNNVYVPSDFNCVATPAFIRSTNKIMRWAIYSDDELPNPYMGLNYFAYLKAMQSKFTFFLPNDAAMAYYYDPMSFTSRLPRVMRFLYTSGNFPFSLTTSRNQSVIANYDIANGTIGADMRSQRLTNNEIINRLRQMLEHNTIVHQNGINAINTEEDEYYLSKNGMGIKVTRGTDDKGETHVIRAQGGFQLENEREGLVQDQTPGIQYCNVVEAGDYKNGFTFTLDAPLIPAARSVFSVLSNIKRGQQGNPTEYLDEEVVANNPYYQFFRLCLDADEDMIKKSGLVNENDPLYDVSTQQGRDRLNRAINKYRTFLDNNAIDQNVQFFNNYRYTVFAPSNEAVLKAIEDGLPTWESIQEDFDQCDKNNEGNLANSADSLRLQAKILYLTNFIRTHFADNTVFADKSETGTNGSPVEMVTSSYDNDKGVFIKAYVQRVKNGSETTLQVRDNFSTDQWRSASNDERYKNIMTCDRECSAKVKDATSLNGITTDASSYAVIHLIDGVLNHLQLGEDGKYPTFTDSKAARTYIKKFAIR